MPERTKSYGNILRSSSIVGGAQLIVIFVGMLRVKFVALFLGPLGVGVLGILNSILTLSQTLSDLGLRQAAVKNIAVAVADNQQDKISETVSTLRILCWVLGALGAVMLVAFAPMISRHFFDSPEKGGMVALLAVNVLIATVTGGQMAVVQGFRRISDLAKIQILGAVCGSIVAVLFYYFLGIDGIIPALISLALLQVLWSWLFARRLRISKRWIPWAVFWREAKSMIGLGLSMMWSSLIVALSALAIRALVAKELDLLSVGIYSAAFSLSGYVVNFVLQAMRADYYPQLSSLCDDNKAMSSLVNEQMEIGILLVFIPILGSLILSPVLVTVFYSLEFQGAVDLLQWFLLGCFGRVVSWPVGFIMLAKGKARVFALVQTLFGAVHVMLVFAGIAYYGIVGAAMAFAILYSFTSLVVYTVGKRLIAFEIYRNTLRLLCVASACVILCFTMLQLLSYGMALLVTLPLFIASVIYDIRQMTFRLGYEHRLVRLLVAFPGVRFILKGI